MPASSKAYLRSAARAARNQAHFLLGQVGLAHFSTG